MIFTDRKLFDEFKNAHDRETVAIDALMKALNSGIKDMSILAPLSDQFEQAHSDKMIAWKKASSPNAK